MAGSKAGGIAAAGLLVATILAALIALGAGWISLDLVRDIVAFGGHQVAERPVLSALIVFAAIVLATALCFPIAPMLGMTGGALFGLWLGVPMVLLASTLGSTIACLGSRFLFREGIERRFAKRLAKIDAGLARHGVAYLLSIRLNPIIPYWPVNLAIGCTTMPMREFFWLTLIGLAPSIFVYCLAGTHLGELGHMGEAASWEVAAAMLGLSLVPLAFDRLVLKRRR